MSKDIPTVPYHGGTPSEMLRDLACFLDGLDALDGNLHFATGPNAGKTLAEALRGDQENHQTIQSDVRWLADWIDENITKD